MNNNMNHFSGQIGHYKKGCINTMAKLKLTKQKIKEAISKTHGIKQVLCF